MASGERIPAGLDPDLERAVDFPDSDLAAWRAATLDFLKGKPLEKLSTRTLEGIVVPPLHTHEDGAEPPGYPGSPPFVRGRSTLGGVVAGWETCQRCVAPDPEHAVAEIGADLDLGAGAVWLRFDRAARWGLDADDPAASSLGGDGLAVSTAEELRPLVAAVTARGASLHLDAGGATLAVAALVCAAAEMGQGLPTGSLGADPLADLAAEGELPAGVDAGLAGLGELAVWASRRAPSFRAATVSALPYHSAGASAVQELGFVLATGVEYLRAMERAGLDVDQGAGQVRLLLPVGRDLFMEVAKLRAARRLWAEVVRGCGGSPVTRCAPLHAVSSPRTMTVRDPWVNILRVTVETFAAVVGGADAVTSLPYDLAIGPSDPGARRLAAATQAILREETHLHSVADPAGGSWYVESLTAKVAEGAWALFRQVEAGGGMRAWLERGEVHRLLGESWAGFRSGLATRRVPITGVSSFPLPGQVAVERPAVDWPAVRDRARQRLGGLRGRAAAELVRVAEARRARSGGGELMDLAIAAARAGATLGELRRALVREAAATRLRPLPVHREAEEFEALRAASDRHLGASGARPRAFLACAGPAADFRARAEFSRGFVEAGGIEAVGGAAASTAAELAGAFTASGAPVAVICSSDALYPTMVPELARALRGAGARAVALAGRPGEHEREWREAGVDLFVYLGCDVVAGLNALQVAAGVAHE